uniref:C2H2-type domain-containing protein n=2 Tax=Parascaris univalens TaxID=6257 RepID=A0A915A9W4_PARUN
MASTHRRSDLFHFAPQPTIGCDDSRRKRRMAVVRNVHIVDERHEGSCDDDEDRGHDGRAELINFVGEPPTCFIEETGAVWQGAEEVVVSDVDFSLDEGTPADVKHLSVGHQPSYDTLGASSYEFFETVDDLPQSAVDDEVKYMGVDRSLNEEVDACHQQIAYDLFVTSDQKYPSELRSVGDSTNEDYLRAVNSLYRSNRKFLKLQRQTKRDVSEETFASCRSSSDQFFGRPTVRISTGTNLIRDDSSSQSACRLCAQIVHLPLRIRHIYREHLAVPIFKCPLCAYSSTYHRTNVVAHMRKRHGVPSQDAVPQCTKNEYRTEVEALLYSCFGDTRLVRRRSPSIVECVRDLIDGVCGNSHSSCSQRKFIERSCEDGGEQRYPTAADFVDELTVSRKRRNVGSSALYASICALCHLSGILHRERHVLQHHLNEDVFKCPCCNFSSCYAKNSVKDHIRTQHSHIVSAEPMDLRSHFRDRIDYLYTRCFLNGCDEHGGHAYP